MIHHQPTLFNQLKFPGSLAPGLRAEFAGVVAEPVPEPLMALIRKLQARTDDDKRRQTKSRTNVLMVAERARLAARRR